MGTSTVSLCMIVKNEEAYLADCLASAKPFVDEMVIVDTGSTDRTVEIAQRFGANVFHFPWCDDFAAARNESLRHASGDWILEVDADERVPPELAQEIRAAIETAAPGHFLLPFDNYIGDRLVRYGWGGSWGVMAAPRLFSKGAKRWGEQRVHPGLRLDGRERFLEHAMRHRVDNNISDMLARLDRYTELRAADLREGKGRLSPFLFLLRRSASRFLKCYVFRKGYREGRWGFLIALMAALYPLIAQLKAELERPDKG